MPEQVARLKIDVRRVHFGEVEPLKRLFRTNVGCQIVHDSIMPRGLADAYVTLVGGEVSRGGMVECGRLLVGTIDAERLGSHG